MWIARAANAHKVATLWPIVINGVSALVLLGMDTVQSDGLPRGYSGDSRFLGDEIV
jgi:hypothetical protein